MNGRIFFTDDPPRRLSARVSGQGAAMFLAVAASLTCARPKQTGGEMKLKLMFAFFGVALPLGSALALITPEQIKELPVGTTFGKGNATVN